MNVFCKLEKLQYPVFQTSAPGWCVSFLLLLSTHAFSYNSITKGILSTNVDKQSQQTFPVQDFLSWTIAIKADMAFHNARCSPGIVLLVLPRLNYIHP